MIPAMQHEIVDKRQWLSEKDFLDIISMAQALPGIFAVNMSAYVGHRLKGWKGSLIFASGTVIPSILIILLVALCFHDYSQWHWLESMFKGIRPAVVALIAAPCIRMWQVAGIRLSTLWIPVTTAVLVWMAGVSPVWIIMGVVGGAFLYGKVYHAEDDGKEDRL